MERAVESFKIEPHWGEPRFKFMPLDRIVDSWRQNSRHLSDAILSVRSVRDPAMAETPAVGSVLDFEQSLKLVSTGKDRFENAQQPWTWPGTSTVPGGLLISECAVAAYTTVDTSHFTLDNVQSQFLSRTDPKKSISYDVQRLSSGRRFAVRFVTGSQGGRAVICATICFASLDVENGGNAMRYTVQRKTSHRVETITLDDLEPKTPLGPFMKFQRFPVSTPSHLNGSYIPDSIPSSETQAPITTKIASWACHISSNLAHHPPGHMVHTLGLLNLSDYHVLDCPLTLSKIPFGLFAIGDETQTPTKSKMALFTSLNHNIWFHNRGGFRADEMCYVEAQSTWAHGDGRACIETRIFGKDGTLIATAAQEAFYVFKDDKNRQTTGPTPSKGKL